MTNLALPAPITLAQAMGHAEAIIAEFGPSYVYNRQDEDTCEGSGNGCFYVTDNDEPDCIVAKILHRHGVPIEVLKRWEGFNASDMGPEGTGRRNVTCPTPALVTAEAVDFLGLLQCDQDRGVTWGNAYDYAKWAVTG